MALGNIVARSCPSGERGVRVPKKISGLEREVRESGAQRLSQAARNGLGWGCVTQWDEPRNQVLGVRVIWLQYLVIPLIAGVDWADPAA